MGANMKASVFSYMRRWVFRSKRPALDPANAYARWASTYAPEAHNPLMAVEQAAVLEMLPSRQMNTVRALDLACGSGRYVNRLHSLGVGRVVGMDVSMEMLLKGCEDLVPSPPFVRADYLNIPARDHTFDLIISSLAVGHAENLTVALKEMARVLTPGGTMIYSDFHPVGQYLGWQRTFKDRDGKRLAVHYFPHQLSDHVEASVKSGLQLMSLKEPRLEAPDPPVALVIRLDKPKQ